MSIVRLVVDRLRNVGDVPLPPKRFDHYLLFADVRSADQAARRLRQRHFEVELQQGDDGACTVVAGHTVVPSPAAMEHVTELLERLAAECGGEYDGWAVP